MMKVKETDASTGVLQLQIGTLMQSSTKLNSNTEDVWTRMSTSCSRFSSSVT